MMTAIEDARADDQTGQEQVMAKHTRHVEVEAWPADCLEGECEHVDEDGEPDDLSACPSLQFDTCVDCMVEDGRGDDPGRWDDIPLMPWPHPGSEGWQETPTSAPDTRITREALTDGDGR